MKKSIHSFSLLTVRAHAEPRSKRTNHREKISRMWVIYWVTSGNLNFKPSRKNLGLAIKGIWRSKTQRRACVAVCCNVLNYNTVCCSALQCAAVCSSVLQSVAVRSMGSSVMQALCETTLHCAAVRCSALQCVVACSVSCSVIGIASHHRWMDGGPILGTYSDRGF